MKITHAIVAAAMVLLANVGLAETVHQSVPGDKIHAGDGKNAVEKGQMETKKVDGAQEGQVARVKGDMVQWGYVTCWFGVPAPAGKVTVRLRLFIDADKTAKYNLYVRTKSAQTLLGELKLPADAKENAFVTVDVPVDSKEEWNGLTIKKAEASSLPSPWIDTVSIVLPD